MLIKVLCISFILTNFRTAADLFLPIAAWSNSGNRTWGWLDSQLSAGHRREIWDFLLYARVLPASVPSDTLSSSEQRSWSELHGVPVAGLVLALHDSDTAAFLWRDALLPTHFWKVSELWPTVPCKAPSTPGCMAQTDPHQSADSQNPSINTSSPIPDNPTGEVSVW